MEIPSFSNFFIQIAEVLWKSVKETQLLTDQWVDYSYYTHNFSWSPNVHLQMNSFLSPSLMLVNLEYSK